MDTLMLCVGYVMVYCVEGAHAVLTVRRAPSWRCNTTDVGVTEEDHPDVYTDANGWQVQQ